ncbi:helicase-associated domain-containing protein [Paenibacillus qinlingensis]|uniref:Helicase XPB/Ssl2 N-terminal domain-containing protein n=1 Tax=Paenibacillus qinlingensis TaxID=1837343 RepID=A0ABU1NVK4_9BACL|nr:helicase-associated domain-containing protein [Paenibacillus qinlingensis]MDR6551502.1 hypothetical protein [Paenibacillus qinlingensis]
MKYEHVERKMPGSLREVIIRQPWCAAFSTTNSTLGEVLTSPAHIRELSSELTWDERRTLRLVMSTFGCQPFTKERLEKEAVLQMAGAQISLGLWGLRRYGVIVAFRKSWGDQLLMLPEDAFAVWQQVLFPISINPFKGSESQLEPLSSGEIGEYVGGIEEEESRQINPRGLAQQLFLFMVSCSRQPALPLTNKGTLHKKLIHKLTEHVSLPKRIITMSGLTYAFTDVYNEPAALMLELALQMGFVYKNEWGNGFLIHHRNFEAWLQGTYEQQQLQLYHIWRQALIPAPVWLEHGIAFMERCTSQQWYSLNELTQAILACCSISRKTMDETSLQEDLLMVWMKPLSSFRFIELAQEQGEDLWFKWLINPQRIEDANLDFEREPSRKNKSTATLYVQPDFEVLLPPDASLYLEWRIAMFSDLVNSDIVRTYRLTKESFQRALDHGLKSAEVIQLLQDNAYYEIPEQVIITLEQWEEQKDKLYMQEVTLLRCQSVEVAEALIRNEKCRMLLGERIGDSHFIISREHVKDVTKCLEAMGFHPNQIANMSVEKDDVFPSLSQPAAGLCYSRDTIQLYEIDPYLPQPEEHYPDIQQIPASWIKELRDYHASTRKDMIRKAIEWKSVLQLRKEGRDCFIIPRMLREDRTGWILEGWEEYQEIAWASEDWNEMKLILPGINDGGVREKEETLGEL